MSNIIADLKLVACGPDGHCKPMSIRIHAPAQEPTGDWSCRCELAGLHEELTAMRGEDALHALCLAMGLCATLLRGYTSSGGSLQTLTGEDFPLEAYFRWAGTPVPAA